jgi:hypothetical protein
MAPMPAARGRRRGDAAAAIAVSLPQAVDPPAGLEAPSRVSPNWVPED